MENYTTYRSKVTIQLDIPKHIYPDEYHSSLTKLIKPNESFVISRNIDGEILSRYRDDIWDFTPYKKNNNTSQSKLYFSELFGTYKSDTKWIMFIMIYMSESNRHSRLSTNTIVSYMKILNDITKYTSNRNISIVELFESKRHVSEYVNSCVYSYKLKTFSPIIKNLILLGHKNTDIKAIGGATVDEINDRRIMLRNDKQHPVIPPRIYSYYITFLHEQVTTFLNIKSSLYSFLKYFHYRKAGDMYSMSIDFEKYTKKHRLTSLFKKYNITETKNVSRLLSRIQHCCKTLIHIYTGMRTSEVYSLKINCLKIEKTKSGKILRLLGETSKLIGQRQTTAWITSIEIEEAITLSQWIAKSISKLNSFNINDTPLFISTSYLNLASGTCIPTMPLQVNSLSNKKQEINNYINSDILKIKKSDITFLEKVDPFRSWQDEDQFQIGSNWRVTSHQFRRSLAFYAAQSSLVSLPSLKRQLKHITQEMTIYYAKGSGFFDLFSDDNHFSQTFINTKPEADALAYLYDVILSEESLYGAHGTFIDKNIRNTPLLIEDRDKLIKQFKKGEIAYKETPLGACTTITPCNKKVLREISACITCSRTVIKSKKLNNVIERQKQLVSELKQIDSTSLEYKMEKNELITLLKFQKKISS